MYDVIVIGGGHNGLTCAAYLARAGARVLVVERRELLGGAAVTEEPWPGYRVSTASYVVSLLDPRIVAELRLRSYGYEVFPLDPAYFAPFPDGRGLLLWDDPGRASEEIARFSRRDAASYLVYQHDLTSLANVVRPLLARVPPDVRLTSFADLRAAIGLGGRLLRARKRLARLAELMTMSVADFLCEYFEHDNVRGGLCMGGVIGAWGGPMTPGTAYVLLHHRIGEVGGIPGAWGVVRGGMGSVSLAIASAARAAGAEIRTGAEVVAIDLTAGKTRGVTLADGTQLRARAVVSAVHPTTTFLGLVGRAHLPHDLAREIDRYRSRGSSAKVNLAIAELPDFLAMPGTEPGHQHPEFILSPTLAYVERAWDDAKHGRPSRQPALDCVIPTTKDPELAPPGHHVLSCFVQYAPYELAEGTWDERRDELGDVVVATIGEYAPNLPRAVVHREVLTPLDLERRFGLVGGNIFHGEMAPDQLFSLRPAPQASGYRTPLAGLYLGGSGAHPGGGVMGLPGRNAARVVAHDLRRGRIAARRAPGPSRAVSPRPTPS